MFHLQEVHVIPLKRLDLYTKERLKYISMCHVEEVCYNPLRKRHLFCLNSLYIACFNIFHVLTCILSFSFNLITLKQNISSFHYISHVTLGLVCLGLVIIALNVFCPSGCCVGLKMGTIPRAQSRQEAKETVLGSGIWEINLSGGTKFQLVPMLRIMVRLFCAFCPATIKTCQSS